jgi:hypothetical protein
MLKKGMIVDGTREKEYGEFCGVWRILKYDPEYVAKYKCENVITKEQDNWHLSKRSVISKGAFDKIKKISKKNLYVFLVTAGACKEQALRYARIKDPKKASHLAIDNGYHRYYDLVVKHFSKKYKI